MPFKLEIKINNEWQSWKFNSAWNTFREFQKQKKNIVVKNLDTSAQYFPFKVQPTGKINKKQPKMCQHSHWRERKKDARAEIESHWN
jgi:hypothetical protein